MLLVDFCDSDAVGKARGLEEREGRRLRCFGDEFDLMDSLDSDPPTRMFDRACCVSAGSICLLLLF